MGKEVWVFAEHSGGRISRVTLELLGRAAELGQRLKAGVAAVLVGSAVSEFAREVADYGAEKLYIIEDGRLALYQAEAFASVVADLIDEYKPEIFLLGSTDTGRDLAPRVAAKVGTGLTAHCTDLRVQEKDGVPLLYQVVPGWGGEHSLGIICPERRPQMATVKPGVFDLPSVLDGKKAEIIRFPARLSEKHFRSETLEVIEEDAAQSLADFDVIIGVGWGAYGLGDLGLVRELARVTGGAIGGTRPLVDKGWLGEDAMIGQSGRVIRPKLFISLGASGAVHFTTGFAGAKFILAVDRDKDAPIFKIADIGIVGDLCEVLPCLIDEIKKLR